MMNQRAAKALRRSGVAAMVGVILLVPIALAWRESDLDRWRTLIPASSQLFAVIETVNGEHVMLRTLNEVRSPTGQYYLLANSMVIANALSVEPEATRQEICVTDVQPFDPFGEGFSRVELVAGNQFAERHGLHCLATIADAKGAIGVPMENVKPETVVTISLNGDLALMK